MIMSKVKKLFTQEKGRARRGGGGVGRGTRRGHLKRCRPLGLRGGVEGRPEHGQRADPTLSRTNGENFPPNRTRGSTESATGDASRVLNRLRTAGPLHPGFDLSCLQPELCAAAQHAVSGCRVLFIRGIPPSVIADKRCDPSAKGEHVINSDRAASIARDAAGKTWRPPHERAPAAGESCLGLDWCA
jgi:hypothetical protein